jgi:SPP1 family predicted phage head-tail adaptor
MRAGELRHSVSLQRVTETQSESGEITETWTTLATVRAAVEPLEGREQYLAQAVHATATTRVRLRYYAGLTAKDRVLFGTRPLNILGITDPDERHRELILLCEEVSS